MLGGGHLTGYALEDTTHLAALDKSLNTLLDGMGKDPLFLAVGDGNHSLATAKAYWEEVKTHLSPAEQKNHPARFALAEIVNIHDPALLFEPIHRILTGTDRKTLTLDWKNMPNQGEWRWMLPEMGIPLP